MKCPNCRSTISDDSRFCLFCGASVMQSVVIPTTEANTAPLNQFAQKYRKIAAGALIPFLTTFLWIQLIFGFISSGFLLFGLLFTIPEIIALNKIHSEAKRNAPDLHKGLKMLRGYSRFLFVFSIVISILVVIACVLARAYFSPQTSTYSYNMGGGTTFNTTMETMRVYILILILILIGFAIFCFSNWAKKKYVYSLYDAVTIGGKTQWSMALALTLFIAPFGVFAAIADILMMKGYLSLLYGLLMQFTPGLSTYYFLFLYFVSGYKPVIAALQILCSLTASILAGIMVMKLRRAAQDEPPLF